jgi:hypothetical protein
LSDVLCCSFLMKSSFRKKKKKKKKKKKSNQSYSITRLQVDKTQTNFNEQKQAPNAQISSRQVALEFKNETTSPKKSMTFNYELLGF